MKLYHGNCLEILPILGLVDSIVTDPPYGWKFMGKKWDYDIPSVDVWKACLNVLKPGGHILVCCGTRTQHRMAVNIEDAGFRIIDLVLYCYGSGFPKSKRIGCNCNKDKVNYIYGKREPSTLSEQPRPQTTRRICETCGGVIGLEGFGSALKPAVEIWTLAKKPISEKNLRLNALKYGTGGLNIDKCRIATNDNLNGGGYDPEGKSKKNLADASSYATKPLKQVFTQPSGRFPANLIHDGSEEVVGLFPKQKSGARKEQPQKDGVWNRVGAKMKYTRACEASNGSAARFYYCAKASKAERNMGLEGFEKKEWKLPGRTGLEGRQRLDSSQALLKGGGKSQNYHPTVKPVALMRYLCRLITPPNGVVLDPFMGSGSTGIACKLEGFDFIGIELDEDYYRIAEARINAIKSRQLMMLSRCYGV